jgi:DnaJ-class molecular chaperone
MQCFLLQPRTWACCGTMVSSKAPIIKRLLQTSASQFNPYKTLGVSRSASQNEIKEAFYELSKKHHPDRNPGCVKSAELFKTISAAYDFIGNEEKRRDYETQNKFGTGVPEDYMRWRQAHDSFRRSHFNERDNQKQNRKGSYNNSEWKSKSEEKGYSTSQIR